MSQLRSVHSLAQPGGPHAHRPFICRAAALLTNRGRCPSCVAQAISPPAEQLYRKVTASAAQGAGSAETAWEEWLAHNPLPDRQNDSLRHGTHGSGLHSPAVASNQVGEGKRGTTPSVSFSFRWAQTATVMTRAMRFGFDLSWDASLPGWRGTAHHHNPHTEPLHHCTIRLPRMLLPSTGVNANLCPEHYLRTIASPPKEGCCPPCLLVLLSADSAAMGLVGSSGQLVRHKVMRGYTVRAKQGKSQLYYQQRGGGAGSVGGRIRGREVRRLFRSAGDKLWEWEGDIHRCRWLFHAGDVRVWNELYAMDLPMARDDNRWTRVGLSLRKPRLKELERAVFLLGQGEYEGPALQLDEEMETLHIGSVRHLDELT